MFNQETGMGIADSKRVIKLLWEKGLAPLLMGDRGTGKTQQAFDVASSPVEEGGMGLPVYYFNCSQIDAESMIYPSIREIERFDEGGNPIESDRAIDLITIDGLEKPVVVILDEITNARPSLWSLLLSFVAEKKLGNRHFPNILFIATGNRSENSSLAQPLPRPLMERFCVIDSPIPTKQEWIEFMQERHPEVPAYYYGFVHTLNDSSFHRKETEGGDVEDYKQIPSPRSHTYSATVLSHFPRVEDAKANMHHLYAIFQGYLGTDVAARFMAYLDDANNFLTYDEYKGGKKPATAAQTINLTVDASEALRKLLDKDDAKFFDAIDDLIYDVHIGPVSSLTQYVIDSLTYTTPTDRSTKSRFVGWCRTNKASKTRKILEERKKLLESVSAEFENLN